MNTQVRVTTPPLSLAHRCCHREDGRPKQCWSQPRAERIAARITANQGEEAGVYWCEKHQCFHVGRRKP